MRLRILTPTQLLSVRNVPSTPRRICRPPWRRKPQQEISLLRLYPCHPMRVRMRRKMPQGMSFRGLRQLKRSSDPINSPRASMRWLPISVLRRRRRSSFHPSDPFCVQILSLTLFKVNDMSATHWRGYDRSPSVFIQTKL